MTNHVNRTERTFYLTNVDSITFVGWGPDHGGDGLYFYTRDENGDFTGKVTVHHSNPQRWRDLATKILSDLEKTCPTCGAHHDNT